MGKVIMGTECPTCGRDDFKSDRGMRTHLSAVHDERIRAEITCEYCGDTFKVKPYREDSARFCSASCRSSNTADQRESNKAVWTCENCESTFERYRSQGSGDVPRFCSTDCLYEFRSRALSGENAPGWEGGRLVTTDCEYCDSTIELYKSDARDKRFCSKKCYDDWQRDTSEMTCGRLYTIIRSCLPGQSWETTRTHTLGDSCVLCGSGSDLQAHHIIPVLAGGTNEPWNLLTVCTGCHPSVEQFTREFTDRPLTAEPSDLSGPNAGGDSQAVYGGVVREEAD